MTFDVEIECRVRGRSATDAVAVRPCFRDPHAAAVVLRPSPATFVRPSVGVMNKCQTSSPSELDPCAPRVRRGSGGEWRYEFVWTKIYYNNVEPTRREKEGRCRCRSGPAGGG